MLFLDRLDNYLKVEIFESKYSEYSSCFFEIAENENSYEKCIYIFLFVFCSLKANAWGSKGHAMVGQVKML